MKGFTIIELLIAVSISAVVLLLIISSYSQVYAGFVAQENQLELSQSTRLIFNELGQEILTSGRFGCYDMHTQGVSNVQTSADTTTVPPIDKTSLGIKSFTTATISSDGFGIPANGVTLAANSEILKIQYGSGLSIINLLTPLSTKLSAINFTLPLKDSFATTLSTSQFAMSSSTIWYMLSTCNNLYQLKTTVAISALGPPVKGVLSTSENVPYTAVTGNNLYSLYLTGFHTKYYYVGTYNGVTGLYTQYVQNSPVGSAWISAPELVSQNIQQINFVYLVAIAANNYKYYTTAQVTTGGYWLNIKGIAVNLVGTITFNTPNQTESMVITW